MKQICPDTEGLRQADEEAGGGDKQSAGCAAVMMRHQGSSLRSRGRASRSKAGGGESSGAGQGLAQYARCLVL